MNYKKHLILGLTAFFTLSVQAGTLSDHLVRLQADYKKQVGNQTNKTFKPTDASVPVIKKNQVIVTMTLKKDSAKTVIADLQKKGMTNISQYKNLISGSFPINRLSELENVKNVNSISSSRAITKSADGGFVYNAADTAMFTDSIKKRYNVDGSGIKIGVISDSYNCLSSADADISSGDLPKDVKVLKELSDCTQGTDEGRAMLQLIHDIAPGAKLLFYTGTESPVDMAAGILALQKEGAKVIVDDIGWLTQPFFQDGPIAQAVDDVKAKGVVYFSSAGNNGRLSYESKFEGGKNPMSTDNAHDFGTAAGQNSDFYQHITIPIGTQARFVLQWSDPSEIADVNSVGNPRSKTDLDIFLLDKNKKTILASSRDNNIGHDPVEFMGFQPTTKTGTDFWLYISHRAGVAPKYLKYMIFAPTGIDGKPNSNPEDDPKIMAWDPESKSLVLEDGSKASGGKSFVVIKKINKLAEVTKVIVDVITLEPTISYQGETIKIANGENLVYYVKKGFIPFLNSDGKLVLYPDGTNTTFTNIDTYHTQSSTVFGHSNAAGAISVGAIDYQQTPWFNTYQEDSRIEGFSSAGGIPIFFDKNGKSLATIYRPKPEIVAPDNVDTTFFPAGVLTITDKDGSNYPNFKGTSAAAPNAAAIATLLLQVNGRLTPDQIKTAMMKSALGISDALVAEGEVIRTNNDPAIPNGICQTNTSFDWRTGCGLVQADLVFDWVNSNISDSGTGNSSAGIYLLLSANKDSLRAGEPVDYEFTLINQSDKNLTKVVINATKVPQYVSFGDVIGCDDYTLNTKTFSCSISTLDIGQSIKIKVPVIAKSNPNKNISFVADVSAKETFDKTNAQAALDIPIQIAIGDFNQDGCVDTTDYGKMYGIYRTGGFNAQYDLNSDKKLNLADLTKLKTFYSFPNGASCS